MSVRAAAVIACAAVVGLVLTVSAPSPVWAQGAVTPPGSGPAPVRRPSLSDSKKAASLNGKAKMALQDGDNRGAYKLFTQAHELDPGERSYVHNAAGLGAVLGDTEKAISLYQDALTLALAAKARDDVALYAGEITKLRAALPDWVAQKQAAASAIPAGKESLAAIWERVHQAALTAAAAGDAAKALDKGQQALTIAKDNFGPSHFAALVSMIDLGQIQAAFGQAEGAEASYRQALAAAEPVLGAGHPQTLTIDGHLADLFAAQAKDRQAAEIRAAAVAAATAALGEAHDITLTLRSGGARDLANAGRYAEAETALAPVCATYARAYGGIHPKTGQCLIQQAALARQLGNLDAAGQRIGQALALQAWFVAEHDPAGFPARLEAAAVWLKQGRTAEAQAALEALITDATAANDKTVLFAAKADLTDVLDMRGEEAAAEVLAKEVLAHEDETFGPDHPNSISAMTSLASVHRKQGRLAEAEAEFKLAYERFLKVFGADHRSTLIAANNLGEILEKEGLYDQAEPYLRATLDGSRRTLGDTNPATVVSMNNLALLYESQGNFDKAEVLYQGAIAIFTQTRGADHPDTIAFVNNLAYLDLLKEEFDKAEPLFRRVVAAWTLSYGPRHQNTLKARNSLARVLHREGKLAEAEALFDETLKTRREVLGEGEMDVLRSQIDLAGLYRTEKRLDDADRLLTASLPALEKGLGPLHPYSFEAINALADVKQDKGDLPAAFRLRQSIFQRRTEFFNRMLYVTGDNAREGYIRLHQPEYYAYLDLLTRLSPETAGKALLEASLNRKGILFKVASELQQISRLSRDPEMARIGDLLTETRKRLAALTLSGPTPETKDDYLHLLSGLEERISALQGDLGRASARFRKTAAPLSIEEVIAALPEDAVLVDFLAFSADGKARLVAATARKDKDGVVYGFVPYDDPGAIDAALLKYRKDIQSEDIEPDEVVESGRDIYNKIWKPLEPAIGSHSKVYVIPDASLNILPFTALIDKEGKYLIERIDLHIFTTSRNLLPSHLPPAKAGYMINSGPDYNSEEVTGKDKLDDAKSRGVSLRDDLRGMASGLRGLKFDPLTGAEKEGNLIREEVDRAGHPVTMFSKGAAQEKNLHDMTEAPEILHIATHGFFLKPDDTLRKRLLKLQRGGDVALPPPGDNPLLRAGLAFAGVNANAPLLGEINTDNDGILTALEVLGLDLSGTRLAILSACETGLGEIHEGEGVYGLRRSFQEAGASSVISSLWEVSDAGTQTLMTALYNRLLSGQPPHEALRASQLEMLKNPKWSQPYIWSAFFMVDG